MKRLCLVLFLIAVSTDLIADDWPQWRGPNRTDVSGEMGLQQSWAPGGPNKLWSSNEGGLGYSGFAVVGDNVVTMGLETDGNNEFIICLSAKDGSKKWTANIGEKFENRWGDGPRATPTVDGDFCYGMSGKGSLACVSMKDGKVVWTVEMSKLGGRVPFWGYCESVLVDGGNVICTPGGKQGAIAALNKKNGEVVWQSKDFTDPAQYSSPIKAVINNQPQYIQLTMKSLVAVSPENGSVIWRSDWPGRTAVIPTPIVSKNRVYVSSGYKVGCKAVEITADNKVKEIYKNDVMTNHHGGVILVNGHLYGYSDSRRNGWTCQNLETGEKVWNDSKVLGKGAIAYADGCFYCLSESKGEVVLIKESKAGWEEKGRFTLDPQTKLRKPAGKIWVHPVVANKKLYLRDQEIIYCFDVSK